jgi:hypothetical protein
MDWKLIFSASVIINSPSSSGVKLNNDVFLGLSTLKKMYGNLG